MFCTSCGTENPEDVRFCIQCGFGLSQAEPAEAFEAPAHEYSVLQSPPGSNWETYHDPAIPQPLPEAHAEAFHELTMLQPPPPPPPPERYHELTMLQPPPDPRAAPRHEPTRLPPPPLPQPERAAEATMLEPPPAPREDPNQLVLGNHPFNQRLRNKLLQPPQEPRDEPPREPTMLQSPLDLPPAPGPAIKPIATASAPKRSRAPRYTHQSGEHVGVYTLQQPMGVGGFAEVWKALETTADREVALKIFYDRVMDDPTQAKIFRMEAQKQARLEHERVTPIYYCHLDPQHGPPPYFIAMKLMTGGTLEDVIREKKQIPPQESLNIIRDVVEGLDVAHAAGIIHRDIKPRNVLFDKQGRATLADFGIAKDLKAASQTIAGTVMGTPTYMSPEQSMGLIITQASDIYSVGIMLYEMLAGQPPYTGKNVTEILLAHQRGNPTKLSEIVPGISPALEKIVYTCLEQEVERRYSDCKSLMHEIDGLREPVAAGPSTSGAKSSRPPTRRSSTSRPSRSTVQPGAQAVDSPGLAAPSHMGRNLTILIVALALLALAVGGWWLVSRRKAAPANSDSGKQTLRQNAGADAPPNSPGTRTPPGTVMIAWAQDRERSPDWIRPSPRRATWCATAAMTTRGLCQYNESLFSADVVERMAGCHSVAVRDGKILRHYAHAERA